MRITILTLFPEFFDSFKTNSIIGRAISRENEYESSTIYQNPGWSRNDGTLPEGE